MWKKGDEFPSTAATGCWSEKVIVVTNYANVYLLSFFNGREDKIWQRLRCFLKDEVVECWAYHPFDNAEAIPND